MSDNLKSYETATESLADGASMTVQLPVFEARFVTTLVDDGSGGAPATHDLTWSQRPTNDGTSADGAWVPATTETGTTKRWWLDEWPAPDYWRVELTNQSGGEATFRVRLVSHGGGE
jgi:hypothetical protein